MRRVATDSASPAARRRACSAARACVEAMESRTLLSATPSALIPPPQSSGTLVSDPFTITANVVLSDITGNVFQDNNNNALFDAADTPLFGQTVFIDLNGNNIPDPGTDVIFVTGTTGFYFLPVPAGTWKVQVESPAPGLIINPASPGLQPQTVGFNQIQSNVNFAESMGASISGIIFGDINANGVKDSGETGLAGRTVYADLNNNGFHDLTEPSAVTDVNGAFTITGIGAGSVTIRPVVPAGSRLTAPQSGSYQYNVNLGQIVTGATFGMAGPDLTVAFVKPPVGLVIGGARQKPVAVLVTNVGIAPISSLVGVTLYASLDNTFDPAVDPEVGSILGRSLKLKPGQSRRIRVPFNAPVSVPTGTYHLMARVLSSVLDSNGANDVAIAPTTVQILSPFVDIAVAYSPQPLQQFNYGETATVSVSLKNMGNVKYDGMIRIQVFASTDQTAATGAPISSFPDMHIKLWPQQSRSITVPVSFTLAKGYYYIVTNVSLAGGVADFNVQNNTVASIYRTLIL